MALRTITKELHDIENLSSMPEGITAGPADGDLFEWKCTILGVDGTPYENGIYFLNINFPTDYPFKPPKIWFSTKIYNASVNNRGGIILHHLLDNYRDWKPFTTTVITLLIELRKKIFVLGGDVFDPLVPSIAKQMRCDMIQFVKTAMEWTDRYAESGHSSIILSNLENTQFLTEEQCAQIPETLYECISINYNVSLSLSKSFGSIILEYCQNTPFYPFYNFEPWKRYCLDKNWYETIIQKEKNELEQKLKPLKQRKMNDNENFFAIKAFSYDKYHEIKYCLDDDDIYTLKLLIHMNLRTPACTNLAYRGTVLDDQKTLSYYGIKSGSEVRVLPTMCN